MNERDEKNQTDWVRGVTLGELEASGKAVVQYGDRPVLILWNDGAPVAMTDTCIHRERSLSQGVLLNGRLVCPGHQWAFSLEDGFCRERERYQPRHELRVEGDEIWVGPADRPHPLLDRSPEEATVQR